MKWLKTLRQNRPAVDQDISVVEEELRVRLPADYVAFVRLANGACGPVGAASYVDLWPINELKARNDAYEVDEFAPRLLLFGSDGGDTAYSFNRNCGMRVEVVPFIGMSLVQAKRSRDHSKTSWRC